MRRFVVSGLILAFAIGAVILTAPSADAVSTAVATDGDIYTGAASFSSDRKIKASNSPILRTAISIPPEIVQGVVFPRAPRSRESRDRLPRSSLRWM